MIEPDWSITMHMWPMPEAPKLPDGAQIIEVGPRPHGGRRPNRESRIPARPGRKDTSSAAAPWVPQRDRGGPPPPPEHGARPNGVAASVMIVEDGAPSRKKKQDKPSSMLGSLFSSGKSGKSSSKKKK